MFSASAILIAAVLLLSIFLVSLAAFIIYAYIRLASRYAELDSKFKKEESERQKVRDTILSDSYKSAQDVILNAKRKAESVVKDAQFFRDEQQESFHKSLDQITSRQLEIYQNTLKDIKEDTHVMFEQLLEETKRQKDQQLSLLIDHLKLEIQETTQTYKSQITNLTTELKKSFEVEHDTVTHELSTYRQMMIERIDNSILTIVSEVVSDVVSTGISLKDREDMIMQSLNQAKKKFEVNRNADDQANGRNINKN